MIWLVRVIGESGIRDAIALALPLLTIEPAAVDLADEVVERSELVIWTGTDQ